MRVCFLGKEETNTGISEHPKLWLIRLDSSPNYSCMNSPEVLLAWSSDSKRLGGLSELMDPCCDWLAMPAIGRNHCYTQGTRDFWSWKALRASSPALLLITAALWVWTIWKSMHKLDRMQPSSCYFPLDAGAWIQDLGHAKRLFWVFDMVDCSTPWGCSVWSSQAGSEGG